MDVRRTLALALVVPLLLAGCSEDEPEPKMPDPSPTASEPSPSPTETETAEAESAEDFIRRWQAASDEMQVTGETAEYDAMTPNCKACQGFVASVREVYDAGGRAEFAGTEITRIQRSEQKPPTYDVSMNVPETVIYRSDDGEPDRLPPGKTTIRVILDKTKSEWLVSYFGIVS